MKLVDRVKKQYDELMFIIKDLKTVEDIRNCANGYGIKIEIKPKNGDSEDCYWYKFDDLPESDIGYIRIESWGDLGCIYIDRFDSTFFNVYPNNDDSVIFDVYLNDDDSIENCTINNFENKLVENIETSTVFINSIWSELDNQPENIYKITFPWYYLDHYEKLIEDAKDFIDHCRDETNVDYVKSCTKDLIEKFDIDLNSETLEEFSNWEDNHCGGTLASVLKFIEQHLDFWEYELIKTRTYDADYGEFKD